MANIQNELNNIKNATFGKEVRGSIHDGIDAINKEVESTTGKQVDLESTFDQLVINAGNSNAEIVDARVKADGTSYTKLGDRLDAVDSQLEHIENNITQGLKHEKSKGCVISFLFDDARQSLYDVGLPLFEKKGKKASIGLIVENLEKQINLSMSPQQVLELYSKGWDMMSHGYKSNQLTEDTDLSVAIREIKTCKEIANKYGVELNGFVSPYGVTPSKYMYLVKENYKYAFCNYSSGITDYSKDIHSLNRYSLSNKTEQQIKDLIDNANSEGKYLTLYSHEVYENGNYGDSKTVISNIIDYCDKLNIPIMTVSEAMNYYYSLKEENEINSYSKQLDMVDISNSLLWNYATGSFTNATATYKYNLSPIVEINWNNADYDSRIPYWLDIDFDSSLNNTYCCIEVPVMGGNRVKLETRIEFMKDSLSLGIQQSNVVNIYDKNTKKHILKTYFIVPKNTDMNKLRIRLQCNNTLQDNTSNLKVFTPILKVFFN